MKIVGCDLHTRYQQIAMLEEETGELVERRLEHESGEARAFYAGFAGPVRVGIEATGHTRWFERMLAELGHELWIGDAAEIRASMVRKQKTDARDAAHLLELLLSGRFPRLWRPTMAERDLRQLVWHRQKLVWMRIAVGNQLHTLAMGEGVCRKKKLFTKKGRAELEGLKLDRWASRRRQELHGCSITWTPR
jgi:transposase